jgi:hypothetical protein
MRPSHLERLTDGMITLPDAPGLGPKIDRAA